MLVPVWQDVPTDVLMIVYNQAAFVASPSKTKTIKHVKISMKLCFLGVLEGAITTQYALQTVTENLKTT